VLLPQAGREDPPSWSPRDELANSISLVRRVRSEDDRCALEELMRRYRPRLERKVRVMMSGELRRRFEIDDIVQSALATGIRDLDRFEFREPASLIHWLTRIALNEIRAMSRKRIVAGVEAEPDEEDSSPWARIECERELRPGATLELEERKALFDAAVARLPEHYRDVLLARDYDGGSWDHVAEVMGRSPEACQMIRKRARDMLYEGLKAKGLE
jgi:RNA polymerase sigma-70 factor (ECF subfamily)